MTDDLFRPADDRAGRGDEADDADRLPEHERDDDRTVGGGIMASGGTAIDRGTGELGGSAQGTEADDADEGDVDLSMEPAVAPGVLAGISNGTAPTYVPAESSDDAASPDDAGPVEDDR